MFHKACPAVGVCAVLMIAALSGCKKAASDNVHLQAGGEFGYFQTHFQDESQFIVETIVADIAEMAFYAKHAALPDSEEFLVEAIETEESQFRAPVYDLKILLSPDEPPVELKLSVSESIWAPAVYAQVAEVLWRRLGLEDGEQLATVTTDWSTIEALTDATAETIEEENDVLSAQLQKDFQSARLHERAALLLAAFAFQEVSDDFYDVRSALCRVTAHLTLARALGGNPIGVEGRLADVIVDTLTNRNVPALGKLSHADFADSRCAAWVRSLRARNSWDYRELAKLESPTMIERITWFGTFAMAVDTTIAWNQLTETEVVSVPDFCRIAHAIGPSVQVGHALNQLSLPLEFRDMGVVYQISQGRELSNTQLVKELNRLPERCFSVDGPGNTTVRVIGWGQWAMFYQRQVCHAMAGNFDFMHRRWGVPDEAAEFKASCDRTFSDLRLYPFVRRFNCTDEYEYRSSVDDGFKVTVATPHLVSPRIWNCLCYRVKFAELYQPNPNPHINEWHKHNPPPGTVYDPSPRTDHPSLIERPDTMEQLERLCEMAPANPGLAHNLIRLKYSNEAVYDQLVEIYSPVLEFSAKAMVKVANSVADQPDRYEELMARAASLDPSRYFNLGDKFKRTDEDKAAAYLEKAIEHGSDDVHAANEAGWLVHYYLDHGEKEKARKLANMAGKVYSYSGLAAKAEYLEETGDYAGALKWYKRIEERYDAPSAVAQFISRYKASTGNTRFDAELQSRLDGLFPGGIQKARLGDFQDPPVEGVIVRGENDLTEEAGLSSGDIIVAAQGIRVLNFQQYSYARDSVTTPQLDLIVWQGNGYHEIHASPPRHRFGVSFRTYPSY